MTGANAYERSDGDREGQARRAAGAQPTRHRNGFVHSRIEQLESAFNGAPDRNNAINNILQVCPPSFANQIMIPDNT